MNLQTFLQNPRKPRKPPPQHNWHTDKLRESGGGGMCGEA